MPAGVGNPPSVVQAMETLLSTTTQAERLSSLSAQPPVRPPGTMATEPGSVSSISATRTTAMEPGGLAQTEQGLFTTDTEYPAISSHPQPLSYAHVTRSQRQPATTSTSSPPSTSPKSKPLDPTETTRHHRTQILRRLPYNTTTRTIIDDMTRQMGDTESNLFERVLRDPQDPRRFYIIYRTLDIKTTVTGKGFYIGQTHIKPTDNTITGYIPFPPYYINKTTLDRLLGQYGHHVTGDFVTTPHGTCIAGYKFKMTPNRAVPPPRKLIYNEYHMDIKYDDDIRQCRYCGRYGHLLRQCRTKMADDKFHQRAREEAMALRTTDWRTTRQALAAEFHSEKNEMNKHRDAAITASSDVFNAATIALEGQEETADQLAYLRLVHEGDIRDINCQAIESESYLYDETIDQISIIDKKYVKAGGVIPDHNDAEHCMDSPIATPDVAESVTMDDDLLHTTENRFATKLKHRLQEMQPRPEAPIANQPTKLLQEHAEPPAITPPPKMRKVSNPPAVPPPTVPFENLTAKQQGKLITASKKSLSPNYDYRTHCQYIVRLKTPTTHITSLIRTHLFNIKRRPGYEYLNPMETEICTADSDGTSRIIYVRDITLANHLLIYLKTCRDDRRLVLLEEPTNTFNTSYDPDTAEFT